MSKARRQLHLFHSIKHHTLIEHGTTSVVPKEQLSFKMPLIYYQQTDFLEKWILNLKILLIISISWRFIVHINDSKKYNKKKTPKLHFLSVFEVYLINNLYFFKYRLCLDQCHSKTVRQNSRTNIWCHTENKIHMCFIDITSV